MPIAIIAGTGIYDIPGVDLKERIVETPYGSALIYEGNDSEGELLFLARHGMKHSTPPHSINYRANIKALEMLGVKRVLATNAVGSINKNMPPLSLVAVDDFLDFTSGRKFTFFDGGKSGLKHVDMSIPYCEELRSRLLELAPSFELDIHPGGTYVCTNGPRLETPAEIRMFSKLGGDVVGMTGVPEVNLARELGICYASVSFSINWAAGLEQTISFVQDGIPTLKKKLLALFIKTLNTLE